MTRERVVEIARSAIGRGPDVCASAAPGYDLAVKSWCQIFWLWCLRSAGLTDRLWPSGPEWPRAWLPRTDDPQPGDMAYKDQPFQHGAVFVERVGDRVYTIDGNSPGRVVAARVREVSEWDRFYSIAPLLAAPAAPGPSPSARVQAALVAAGFPCGPVDGVIGPRTLGALKSWALVHPERIER